MLVKFILSNRIRSAVRGISLKSVSKNDAVFWVSLYSFIHP